MPRILADHNIERHFQVLVRLCSSSHWSEIRISKSETNSNFKGKSSKPGGLCVLVIPNFEFPIYLGFRASDFGFQLGDTRGRCIAACKKRPRTSHAGSPDSGRGRSPGKSPHLRKAVTEPQQDLRGTYGGKLTVQRRKWVGMSLEPWITWITSIPCVVARKKTT